MPAKKLSVLVLKFLSLSFPVRGGGSLPQSSPRGSTRVSDHFDSGGWATSPAKLGHALDSDQVTKASLLWSCPNLDLLKIISRVLQKMKSSCNSNSG